MTEQPRVPNDIELPDNADANLQARVADVNRYLAWARENQSDIDMRIKKIEGLRSSGGVHQGANGMVIL